MAILVTGGAGFIGSNFITDWLETEGETVVNLDKLTYAGNRANLAALADDERHIFIEGDIADRPLVEALLDRHQPKAIINFAAETHVDRSIHGPEAFINTNILGTCQLLAAVYEYWSGLTQSEQQIFRLLHISTDEVYGSLPPDQPPFSEQSPYQPNSPYSASKAASDHMVRAYYQTYGLPVLTTSCSNNYGPFQFPEKLIPLIIHNALSRKPLPVYGDGQQVRDWLYVSDHCAALRAVLKSGVPGEVYNIGGLSERKNIEVVHTLCDCLDEMMPLKEGTSLNSYRQLITHVNDRPGHDRRYAIDISKINRELNWQPRETFESGIRKTITWYLDNQSWIAGAAGEEYSQWIERHYA